MTPESHFGTIIRADRMTLSEYVQNAIRFPRKHHFHITTLLCDKRFNDLCACEVFEIRTIGPGGLDVHTYAIRDRCVLSDVPEFRSFGGITAFETVALLADGVGSVKFRLASSDTTEAKRFHNHVIKLQTGLRLTKEAVGALTSRRLFSFNSVSVTSHVRQCAMSC